MTTQSEVLLATGRPKRGKWHRAVGSDFARWACSGLLVRPTDLERPLSSTAEEDRCRLCWPAGEPMAEQARWRCAWCGQTSKAPDPHADGCRARSNRLHRWESAFAARTGRYRTFDTTPEET